MIFTTPSCLVMGFQYFLTALTILLAVDIWAENPPDIYAAEIPVINESEDERKRAIRAGLSEVVVKASGRPSATTLSGVEALLDNAALYVSEYQYVYAQSGNPLGADRAPVLNIQYLEAELESALRSLHLPVWPSDRPLLMLWVSERETSGLRLLNSDEPAYRSLATLLTRRGVRLETPLLDLQDELVLGELDVDSPSAAFTQATERYQLKHWLHVHYQTGNGTISGAWQLSGTDAMAGNAVEAGSLTGFMVASADQAVEQFSENFSYAPAEFRGSVSLVVENVLSYQDYQGVVLALQTLELVREVQVSGLKGEELSLELGIEGEAQRLIDTLNKDVRFTYVAQVGASSDGARRYIWGGR